MTTTVDATDESGAPRRVRVFSTVPGFDTGEDRHQQGCYIDVDAVHSKARRNAAAVPA